MSDMSYTPIKYNKLVCDLKNNILHDVLVLINNKFEPLINETTNDSSIQELNCINKIIRQFPLFQNLEQEYRKNT